MTVVAATANVSLVGLGSFPLVQPGDDLAEAIVSTARHSGVELCSTDIVVVAQKIVSKAEGRIRYLDDVVVTSEARRLAQKAGKDPRLVAAILEEASTVIRVAAGVLIVESRLGHIMANAGLDRSNTDFDADGDEAVLLLPENPDRSAVALRARIHELTGKRPGVVVSDSFGRPWRLGTTSVAIGVAGPPAVVDKRGNRDLFGRRLEVTEVGFADAVAAAAGLVMGEADEGRPIVVARGLEWSESNQSAADGLRPKSKDLFR